MSAERSRQTFDPQLDFLGVLMQPGRVLLDADWNELVEILDRRIRTETTDIIGRCTVPKETPDGFKITLGSGTLTIGRGRMYVHGLLAENHGKPPLEFDDVLAEQRGTLPTSYAEQPYFPNAQSVAPLPQEGGPHLVYLDVWEREVTYLERPELIEKAVGVDTTARLQTVWQVKALVNAGADATCATPDGDISGWLDVIQPSAGRLTTAAVGVPSSQDPCLIPPTGGYRGLDNRFYRVEIHQGGPQSTATFKWSRDTSVATNVTAIPALDKLVVVRTGRDSSLRFNTGDWVEITDDWQEFAQQPGVIRQVKDVSDATQTITLTSALPAGTFPTTAQGRTDQTRHTRIRRWDQKGEVRDTNGNVIIDLNAPGSAGVIPVPPPGASIILEDGVQVTFTIDPTGGRFRTADYWTFAARAVDASVETLDHAPPRGIHHHYCRLAMVTLPNTVTDCRTLWPPETGEGCDCSVCVTADSHNNGTLTLQWAVDQVKTVGGTVCLGPGLYNLGESPLRVVGAQSIRLKGQGWKSVLVYGGRGSAVAVESSLGVTIEELTVLTAGSADNLNPAVSLRNCAGVRLEHDYFMKVGNEERPTAAIGLGGVLVETSIQHNVIVAAIGIGTMVSRDTVTTASVTTHPLPLLTAGLSVQHNVFISGRRGISLDGVSLHTYDTRLANNLIQGGSQGGIVALGWVMAGASLDIQENEINAAGHGIIVGTDGVRINHNDIRAVSSRQGGDGIVLAPGIVNRTGLDRCQIVGNRILGMPGNGISMAMPLKSGFIKQNMIEGVGGGGIVMDEKSRAGVLSVENNQILNIATRPQDHPDAVVGVRLVRTDHAMVAHNTIIGVGRTAAQIPGRAGIQTIGCVTTRIANNEVSDIGPIDDFLKESIGIECIGAFERVDVTDNSVRRNQIPPTAPGASRWSALRIQRPSPDFTITNGNIRFIEAANGFFVFLGGRLLLLPRGREIVAVHGNLLEAYGEAPCVMVGTTGTFGFANNRCLLSTRGQPVAAARVGAIMASANYLQGQANVPAFIVQLPDRGPLTMVGNIASGSIQINGAALALPWAPLNVVAS
jgi:hypothetical protein